MAGIEALVNNPNLKRVYSEFIGALFSQYDCVITALEQLGGKNDPKLRQGERDIFLVELTQGATAGVPNSKDLSYLDPGDADYRQIAIQSSFLYGYSTIDWEKVKAYQESGEVGKFVDELTRKTKHCARQMVDLRNAMFAYEGYGKIGELADAGAQIASGATGTITVKMAHLLKAGWLIQPYLANSAVSGVVLQVQNNPDTYGEGDVSVKNVGASTYTQSAAHILYVAYGGPAHARISWPGILSHTGTGLYPSENASTNNIGLNNSLFDAHQLSSGNNKLFQYTDILLLEDQMSVQNRADLNVMMRNQIRDYECLPGVYLMNQKIFNALRKDTFSNNIQHDRFKPMVDVTWGKIYYVDGIPVKIAPWMVDNTVVRIYAPSFRSSFTQPELLSDGKNGFERIPGSTQHELAYGQMGATMCVDRRSQGKITNIRGLESSDVGH